MRKRGERRWIWAVMLAGIFAIGGTPVAVMAQTRSVSGIVVDESGGAIEGAHVSLAAAEGGSATTTITNTAGEFSFAGVRAGRYVVRVEHDLFRPAEQQVTAAGSSQLRITLAIASFSDTVQVRYRSPSSSVGTKIDVPLADIPQSIQVVPLAVLQDRGVTSVEQMVETVSGVHAEASYGSNEATYFNVRGFSTSSGLRDGFRSYGYVSPRDVQAIDRVEVLKGPASVLYGATSSLGGYINTVSKQPQATAFSDVGVTVTPYGVRPTADLNGPLNKSGTLSGRFNLAVEHNETFRDQGQYDSFTAAPSIAWSPSSTTNVTAVVEYNYLSRQGFDFGMPNIPDASSLSRTRDYGSPADFGRNHGIAATIASRHRLSASWTWREAANYTRARQNSYQTFPQTPAYTGGSRIDVWLFPSDQETDYDWALQSELNGRVNTGGIRHQILVGFEFAGAHSSFSEQGVTPVYNQTIDLFDPSYRSEPSFAYDSAPFQQPTKNQGLYFQDLMAIGRQFKVLAGLRGDWLHTTIFNDGQQTDHVDTSQPSPRVGLVWQPQTSTSIYGSWSRAFSPVVGRSSTGAAFDPETGTQLEVGWKQQFPRATATVAWFDLKRKGVLTLDQENTSFFVQSGEQRSRGFEVDLAGEAVAGINWIASYAYTQAEVTSDNSFPVGDRLANVPLNSGSVWATYRRRDGHWRGITLGAGLVASGSRAATLPNTFELAGYARTDVMGSYGKGNWKLQLNGFNIFNQKYFLGGSAGVFNYTVTPSAPATIQLTLTRRF